MTFFFINTCHDLLIIATPGEWVVLIVLCSNGANNYLDCCAYSDFSDVVFFWLLFAKEKRIKKEYS